MIGPAGKIVVRYSDGRLVKGYSYDFSPGRARFHVFSDRHASAEPTPVVLSELKAVYLVRDHAGNPQHVERKQFTDGMPPRGRRVEITFSDGEVLVGSTESAVHDVRGIFITPADPATNNLQVYAVSTAVRRARVLSDGPAGSPARQPAQAQLVVPRSPAPLLHRIATWLVHPALPPQSL